MVCIAVVVEVGTSDGLDVCSAIAVVEVGTSDGLEVIADVVDVGTSDGLIVCIWVVVVVGSFVGLVVSVDAQVAYASPQQASLVKVGVQQGRGVPVAGSE